MKYKVNFYGFAYVEAEDEEEAKEKVDDGICAYSEIEYETEEVEDFVIEW